MFAIILMVSVAKCAGLMFISAVVGLVVSFAFYGKERAAIQNVVQFVEADYEAISTKVVSKLKAEIIAAEKKF